MFKLNKWQTLHVDGRSESQDELQSVEDDGEKCYAYGMKVRVYKMIIMLIIYM